MNFSSAQHSTQTDLGAHKAPCPRVKEPLTHTEKMPGREADRLYSLRVKAEISLSYASTQKFYCGRELMLGLYISGLILRVTLQNHVLTLILLMWNIG
jgi:hypothetical protein